MLKQTVLAAFWAAGLALGLESAAAMSGPVTIEAQGSFMAGGATATAPGTYDGGNPADFSGQTLHGDHAYVFYQKPVRAHAYGMVFLHGYGQSSKTWETTPDGRDGFQNIFLERGYATYLVDQPRRGRPGGRQFRPIFRRGRTTSSGSIPFASASGRSIMKTRSSRGTKRLWSNSSGR